MADENAIPEKALEFSREIFSYLISNSNGWGWGRFISICLLLLLFAIAAFLFIKALTALIEQMLKLFELLKGSGISVVFSAEKKKRIRRRQQFCSVLDADLAYLAKTENWNDQYFTDLEAEVEIEGGYYTSIFRKLRKQKFHGVRRVSSLMRAISTSAERTVLLVGEPGSGKSVALRHLAKRLAEKGKKSKDFKALIPLYINLRELELPVGVAINADLIRQFVLENIRRGDADTSAFVQENWLTFKDQGIWFFLFDSFDEIPDVFTRRDRKRCSSKLFRCYTDVFGRHG